MTTKIRLKYKLRKALISGLFVLISLFGLTSVLASNSEPVYALPEDTETQQVQTTEVTEGDVANAANTSSEQNGDSCKDSLGALGWLVCPTTGKISEAVDWLYEKIESILVIKPISAENGSPIYEIWKYLKGVTNIVFIIFLLVVIYSQITGLGISNYGIKKALPKLIIAAVLVNLSFLICQLAVDASNIIGDSLRGVFTSISESAVSAGGGMSHASFAKMYTAIGSGAALALGAGVIAFETGAIWMLIPVVLGALVAVVSGLITIALRQAVVALLIMISPLAMVAYMLPNTEKWFTKWKDLLFKMLVFYPMFSLLFGASQLAGFAIIASAKDGFGVLLGTAVQIFPLFFSWTLMKMSGTFLGAINAKLNSLATGPLATNRAWADSHRQLTRANHLERRSQMPSARLMAFLESRRTKREGDIDEMTKNRQMKYLAARTLSSYDKNGNLSKRGQKEYDRQALTMRYSQIVEMHKGNMNQGFGAHSQDYKRTIAAMKKDFSGSRGVYSSAIGGGTLSEKIDRLDRANLNASDDLKTELARGAKIEYENAKGFHERVAKAMNAHVDLEAIQEGNVKHQFHGVLEDADNLARYERMKDIMEGKDIDTSFVVADAAHAFNAQAQIVRGKFKDYFDYTAPTQDVVNLLNNLTKNQDSNSYIDPIIAGMRTLNMRGDTDLVRTQLNRVLEGGKVELGTYTSQSLANFLMFDVKDNDPFLRRFGKYINLETAKMFNEPDNPEDRRTRKDISLYEYVNGEYVDQDENGNVIRDADGRPRMRKSKRSADVLLTGTSFKGMERTAIADMIEGIREQSVDIDENGNKTFNYEKFKKNEERIWNAIMPNIIGDQFSFLSGSEQILALGKGLTGVDVKKHKFAWEDIFGKDLAASLTPEQKKDYIDFVNKRTKAFLGGHVPVQIARTKSDMLEAVRNQYTLRDAAEEDPDFLERSSDPDFRMSKEEYDELERSHLDGVREEFVGSFKKDALKGFTKMYQKGYQGEAKDGLIQLLNPDELYRQFFPNGENNRRNRRRRQDIDDDDDDGMPMADDMGSEVSGSPIYNEARLDIESIHNEYRGPRRLEVEEFWGRIKDVILSSPDIGDSAAVRVEEIERGLSQYTDVNPLYERIMREFFGSD